MKDLWRENEIWRLKPNPAKKFEPIQFDEDDIKSLDPNFKVTATKSKCETTQKTGSSPKSRASGESKTTENLNGLRNPMAKDFQESAIKTEAPRPAGWMNNPYKLANESTIKTKDPKVEEWMSGKCRVNYTCTPLG